MPNIEIVHPDPETGATRLVIDGADLSMSARSVTVHADYERPRVTVEFMVNEAFHFASDDAVLIVDEAVADMLERHGWKRPKASR